MRMFEQLENSLCLDCAIHLPRKMLEHGYKDLQLNIW